MSIQIPRNDTARVRAYASYRAALTSLRASQDPADVRAYRAMRDEVVSLVSKSTTQLEVERALAQAANSTRGIAPSAVHASSFMSNMSVQYANEEYIVDELIPVVPVDHLTDQYPIYGKRDRLAVPNDLMKGRSSANEVSQSRSTDTFTTEGRGLKEALEKKTIDNQDQIFDEMMDLNTHVADLMAFSREKRGMALLTNAANYGSNTAALSGTDQWNATGGGDPVGAIRTAVYQLWRGNGPSKVIGFTTLPVYLYLGTHPKILDLTKYTSAGIVPRQVLASLFELDDLLIAKAWEDTANEGQAASYSRMTPAKVFGVVRVATNPSKRNASFAYNFRFKGQINTMTWMEEKEGTRGTYYHQQTVDEVQKVVAPDTGYLLTAVMS